MAKRSLKRLRRETLLAAIVYRWIVHQKVCVSESDHDEQVTGVPQLSNTLLCNTNGVQEQCLQISESKIMEGSSLKLTLLEALKSFEVRNGQKRSSNFKAIRMIHGEVHHQHVWFNVCGNLKMVNF